MALSLKDPETDRLARELAERTGESLTTAVREALRDKLSRMEDERRAAIAARLAAIKEIVARFNALPNLDDRTADEILGWDENGLPT